MQIGTIVDAAHVLAAHHLSIIPIKPDTSKASAIPWKEFQGRIMSDEEIDHSFAGPCGIAVIAGAVSGNLEIIDIEASAPQVELAALIEEHLPGLLPTLSQVNTPSGGRHIFYRCNDIARNQKLALGADAKVLIETRGEGGYVLTVTSPPECHASGKLYTLANGSLTTIPTITPEQRDILLSCCRSFNRYVRDSDSQITHTSYIGHGKRPGDDYNARGDALSVLLAHGWKVEGRSNGTAYLRRPGKEYGISASFGHVAPNTLYVFSSNAAPFDFERAYDAFGIVARLEYAGDFDRATRELREQGFGEPLPELPSPPPEAYEPESNVKSFQHPKTLTVQVNKNDAEPVLMSANGGKPAANLDNALSIFETHKLLRGIVWFDEFLNKMMTDSPPREWRDTDDLKMTLFMQRRAGLEKISREITSQAALLTAHKNVKNCVRDWLNSLEWDEEPRIEHCLEDHFGTSGTEYVRAISCNFWLSLVARIYQPGCQSDYMLVLEGKQGSKKSSALQIIGGDWYSEQLESATGKSFFETIQGKLIIEISEFDSFSRADITRVKQIITCRSDRFRESYGRYAKDHPRQCVFVATTNREDWNRDETGARRFWPIRCNDDIDLSGLKANRYQLFAEAVHCFKAGMSWWETPSSETLRQQDDRYEHDAWSDSVAEWLSLRRDVTSREILIDCLKFDLAKIGKGDQMRVGAILRRLGWRTTIQRDGSKIRRLWTKV